MPVADTSFIIDLIRHERAALKKLDALEQEGKTLCITWVNALELFTGAYRSAHIESNVKEIIALLNVCEELPFSAEIYHTFGYLSAALHRQGNPVGDFDLVIAAMALSHDREIVTRDHHFEKIPDLVVLRY
ncbi:MAG: type II toxin-antitoxin system VapC family toxin [Methanoregula sp.]|nr:type II toxin-antitoxin system VapC family toxin [Methanoregula sp.]